MDESTPEVGAVPADMASIPPPPPSLQPVQPLSGIVQPPPPAAPTDQLIAKARVDLMRSMSGARWFYWIAGLSIVNSIIHFSNGTATFVVGLGTTQITDAYSTSHHQLPIGIAIALIISGLYVLFGYFALKRQLWAFVTGMVLYLLDGLIFVGFMFVSPGDSLFPLLFHAWVLYGIIRGLIATLRFQQVEKLLQSAS